nr:hypothetical protein [uncultured Jannaschia sp.]
MFRIECASRVRREAGAGQRGDQDLDPKAEPVTLESPEGRDSHGLRRIGRRTARRVDRPIGGDVTALQGVVADLAHGDGAGREVENERGGARGNAQGHRVRAQQRLGSSERMHQSLARRHDEADHPATHGLLCVIGQHPDVVGMPNARDRHAQPARRRLQIVHRGEHHDWSEPLPAVQRKVSGSGPGMRTSRDAVRQPAFETRHQKRQPLKAVRRLAAQFRCQEQVRL